MYKINIHSNKFFLSNGLRIVLAPDDRAPRIALSVGYNLNTQDLIKRKNGTKIFLYTYDWNQSECILFILMGILFYSWSSTTFKSGLFSKSL